MRNRVCSSNTVSPLSLSQNVNITGFRLVDPNSEPARRYLKKFPKSPSQRGRAHPLYSSNALIYDAVQVLAKALNDLSSLQVIEFTSKQTNKLTKFDWIWT